LGIGNGDQKEIEGTGLMAEVIDVALPDQAMIHPAELFGDLAEFGTQEGVFVHGGCLLG
jgi:hypothetical protein